MFDDDIKRKSDSEFYGSMNRSLIMSVWNDNGMKLGRAWPRKEQRLRNDMPQLRRELSLSAEEVGSYRSAKSNGSLTTTSCHNRA